MTIARLIASFSVLVSASRDKKITTKFILQHKAQTTNDYQQIISVPREFFIVNLNNYLKYLNAIHLDIQRTNTYIFNVMMTKNI